MLVIAIIYDRVTGSKITRWIMWPAILGFIAIVIAIMIKGFIDQVFICVNNKNMFGKGMLK